MKTAIIPQVRVEPDLRNDLEAALQPGESLSEFVEAAVRHAVEFRRVQRCFHERGEAAWQTHLREGGAASVPADEVLDGLAKRLDTRRKQLGG